MRAVLPTIVLLAVAALPIAPPSAATAADLAVTPVRKAAVHVRHHRLRAVRDYDGTPIVLRPRPDGTTDAFVVPRAEPTHYLNGEPVGPRYARR